MIFCWRWREGAGERIISASNQLDINSTWYFSRRWKWQKRLFIQFSSKGSSFYCSDPSPLRLSPHLFPPELALRNKTLDVVMYLLALWFGSSSLALSGLCQVGGYCSAELCTDFWNLSYRMACPNPPPSVHSQPGAHQEKIGREPESTECRSCSNSIPHRAEATKTEGFHKSMWLRGKQIDHRGLQLASFHSDSSGLWPTFISLEEDFLFHQTLRFGGDYGRKVSFLCSRCDLPALQQHF